MSAGVFSPNFSTHETVFSTVTDPTNDDSTTVGVPLMIPLSIIEKLTLKQKYVLKRYGLCFMSVIETKTKLKFYETKVFIAVMWFVSIVLAAFGMPAMFIAMWKGQFAAGMVKLITDDPVIIAIVGFAVGVLTLDVKSLTTTNLVSSVATVGQLAQKASEIWFQMEIKDMQTEMEHIKDENEKLQDIMDEYKRQTIYIDFSEDVDNMFRTMYELPYEIYDTLTDMDIMLKLPPTLPK